MSRKSNLAIFRSGAQSLHPKAVARLEGQNFDYALSYYGDGEPPSSGAVFVDRQPGAKWPGLERTLLKHRDLIGRYDYVWLPDDDLLCEPELVSRMFAICSDLGLDLAQPALTQDSYHTHVVTLQHPEFQVRFTNFVEIMAPVFSRAFLEGVLPTLRGNLSGYGLDGLWPRMSRLGRVAIIDDTPVRHTRPISNSNYSANREAGIPAMFEDYMVSAAAFIEAPADFHINFGGLLKSGEAIALGTEPAQINRVLQALVDSLKQAPVAALPLTRYLSNHLAYSMGGEYGRIRYPRDVISIVLNQALAPTGIRFPGALKHNPAPVAA